jgi:uncharacterized membrane protein
MSTVGDIEARLDRVERTLHGLQLEVDEIRLSAARASAPIVEPAMTGGTPEEEAVPVPAIAPEVAPEPVPAPTPEPPAQYLPPLRVTAPTSRPPRGRTRSDRVRAWVRRELTGTRLFALGGGTLMLLGIVFLFVVAANRGWIGAGDRVVLGALASAAVLVAGLVLRRRYGRVQASLAAIGVAIGGAYTTLAAATILYGFVPSWGALLLAAGIAAVGGVIAVAWSSQLLAGLALVGAAAAPGLVALDDGISAPAPAFALIVLAVAIAVAAPRRWLWLVVTVGTAALPQVAWLVADSPAEDAAALAVAAAASLVLLLGAIAWQASAAGEGVDAASSTMALLGGGLALGAAHALLPDARDEGVALAIAAAVYGSVAIATARRYRDLGWVVGAAALALAGVATADLLSGRSLSIAFAVQAVVLAGLAWRLSSVRFELTALTYLGLGVAHVASVELDGAAEAGDVPIAGVPALFALAAAALFVGLLLPVRRPPWASGTGVAALLDDVARGRIVLRAALTALALGLAAAGSAGLLSGRWLTIAWALTAVLLGAAAFAARESRLVALALPALGLAVAHAWVVEAPFSSLALERGLDPLAPVTSLVALGVAAAVVGLTCSFRQRGLRGLGGLEEAERHLAALDGPAGTLLREALLLVGLVFGGWAVGLVAVDVSYEWGQVAATAVWAVLGTALVARGAATRVGFEIVGWGFVAFGFVKCVAFDWGELGASAACTSVLVVAAALLIAGFASRWLDQSIGEGVELLSLGSATLATLSAIVGLGRVAGDDSQALGAAFLVVAIVLTAFAVPPFLRWRRHGEPPWARTMATGYWVLAVATLLLAEGALCGYGPTRALTAWAATATVVALTWRRVGEPRLWLAGLTITAVAVSGAVVAVAPPERLVLATAHPGQGLSAVMVCLVAAAAALWSSPQLTGDRFGWLAGSTAALGVYTVSLAVLEVAERLSGASIQTDFQRGHTALSTLLGLGALAVYVVGLARDHRPLRLAGLTLFGLALGKLFLYDLSSLSSITRALSFLALGAVLLAAAFFAERVVRGGGESGPADPRPVAR